MRDHRRRRRQPRRHAGARGGRRRAGGGFGAGAGAPARRRRAAREGRHDPVSTRRHPASAGLGGRACARRSRDPRVVGGAFRLRFETALAGAPADRVGHAPARRAAAAAVRRSGAVRAPQRARVAGRDPAGARSWRTSIWCARSSGAGGSPASRSRSPPPRAAIARRERCAPCCATGSRWSAGGWGCRASASRPGCVDDRGGARARAGPRRAAPPERLRAAQPRLLRGLDREHARLRRRLRRRADAGRLVGEGGRRGPRRAGGGRAACSGSRW